MYFFIACSFPKIFAKRKLVYCIFILIASKLRQIIPSTDWRVHQSYWARLPPLTRAGVPPPAPRSPLEIHLPLSREGRCILRWLRYLIPSLYIWVEIWPITKSSAKFLPTFSFPDEIAPIWLPFHFALHILLGVRKSWLQKNCSYFFKNFHIIHAK